MNECIFIYTTIYLTGKISKALALICSAGQINVILALSQAITITEFSYLIY